MTKRTHKQIQTEIENIPFKLKIGYTNKKTKNNFYVIASSWIKPTDEEEFLTHVKKLKKGFNKILYDKIGELNVFDSTYLPILDLKEYNVIPNKYTFFSFEIHFKHKDESFDIGDFDNQNTIKDFISNFINEAFINDNFLYRKNKNSN